MTEFFDQAFDEVPEQYVAGAKAIVLLALTTPIYELHLRHEAFLHVALRQAWELLGGQQVQWTICEALSLEPISAPFALDADLSLMPETAQPHVQGMIFGACCALQVLATTDAARRTRDD